MARKPVPAKDQPPKPSFNFWKSGPGLMLLGAAMIVFGYIVVVTETESFRRIGQSFFTAVAGAFLVLGGLLQMIFEPFLVKAWRRYKERRTGDQ